MGPEGGPASVSAGQWPIVGLAGLEPAPSSLSGIEGSALCRPGFPQVTWERQGRRDAFLAGSFQAVRASQAGPTAPVGDSSISLPAVAEAWPADAGDQARPDGSGPGPGRHRSSADAPRTWPRAQRQPQPLRRAIPTLTGAVLVVNAAWVSSSALLRSAASVRSRRWFVHLGAGLVPGAADTP